ncbi:diguanylate cyclase (GGDEF)-like protein [Lysinibacillus composti]|uniref:EAL domain-containing protein n=1 Tax=Lysinibacillus composti TaxID=720633 RepID=A0A3N9UCP6_9BACI|nr:EAL domain-containing protein [Lysinibacillus composti]MBM7609113.1 diguanylate cyclase (GGDEF)-like protein [Lysinibacillus composti]RQW74173.1 EAL domain-containing protein [Lysinibacillus composti]
MSQILNSLVIASTHTSHFSIRTFFDLLTSLAYFTIPLAILFFMKKRKHVKFKWIYICFTLFILLCGFTHALHVLPHLMSIEPLQSIQTIAAGLTATISIITAIMVWSIMPRLLRIPSTAELEEANKEIRYLAHYDMLTGLINRNYFNILMEQVINEATQYKKQFAVVFIDLDRFKMINDSYGHRMGDLLLEEVSNRIVRTVGEKDIVSRQGGDEFILLLQDVSPDKAEITVNKILGLLSSVFILDGKEIHCTPSVGISCFPTDALDAENLIKYADLAMYKAKETGRNNYKFFTKAMNEEISFKLSLENDLRKALVKEEFEVYYQPQLDLNTNRIVSVEALLRWHHPEKGFVSPADFIPLAEETGLIVPIGEWVLRESCKQTKKWRNQGHDISISVNLSNQQLISNHIVELVKEILIENQLDPQYLTLEITESLAITNLTDTLNKLKKLQEIGVTIALDDFGTGYSSLSYLSTLPINFVKIDKSFINDICDKTKREIVKSVSRIASSRGLTVVAEGVEEEEQIYIIQSLGIGMIQGYYLSKPVPSKEMEKKFLEKLSFV